MKDEILKNRLWLYIKSLSKQQLQNVVWSLILLRGSEDYKECMKLLKEEVKLTS